MSKKIAKQSDTSLDYGLTKEAMATVNGVSLSVTFIVFGIFLSINPSFYGDSGITSIARWIFIILGAAFFCTSSNYINKEIGGGNEIGGGILLISLSIPLSFIGVDIIRSIVITLVDILAIYCIVRGLSIMIATTMKYSKEHSNENGTRTVSVFAIMEFLTKASALIVVLIQIYQAIFVQR